MSLRALILVNPHSGRGRSNSIAQELHRTSRSFGFLADIIQGNTALGSQDLLREKMKSSPDVVIVVGGDGLFNVALQVVAQTSVPIFVVPAGTGNDFARNSGYLFTSATEIWSVITRQSPQAIDLALVNGSKWYGQIMSTGFDSIVNQRANRISIIKGQMKYNLATLIELPRFKPISYEISIDGKKLVTDAMMVTIGNGRSYGGGMQIFPHANRKDSLLDVMVINPVSKIELLKVFPKVFDGKHIDHPRIDFYTGREISLNSQALAYADGEYFGEGAIEIQVKPAALLTWSSL